MSRWTLILWRCCDEGWMRTTGDGAESARQSTGKPAVVFERDIAVEDEAAGFVVDHVSARHAPHDAIVFDLPAAHGGGVGEVEEDFGGLGVGLGQAEETDDCEGEKVRHKNLT